MWRSCRGKECIFIFVLEEFLFGIEIEWCVTDTAHKSNISLVEELVLSRESLHPIRYMPRDGVPIFPVNFQGVPDGAKIFRILEYNDREVGLLHLCDIRHLQITKVIRQYVSLKVPTIFLSTEADSHAVLLFRLAL